MTTKALHASYEYDRWANGRLLAVVSQLTSEQFTRDVAGAYGSVRNTMVHIYSAQWGWLDRCGGATRGDRLDPADYPTVESLSALWATIEDHLDDFLSRLTDEDLDRNVDFQVGHGSAQRMPLGELMQHAATHAVHHRGQVALLLRSLGFPPGNFDLLLFLEEKHAGTWSAST